MNLWVVMDWSLIMGRRGATKLEGGGGQVKFHPYKKRGGPENIAMRKGNISSFGVVLTQELEVLAIVMGECQKVSTL